MENREIILWNIKESKQRIKYAISKDRILIFFTRILEDLNRYKNPNFYGRIKEIYHLLFPFDSETDPKKIISNMRNCNLNITEGLKLDNQEINYFRFFIKNLDEKCKLKNVTQMKKGIEDIQRSLVIKYLPNSSKLLEPFLLGKLISSMKGIEKISKKPSSTVQLIGAEKALFRHMSKNTLPPKHGIIFYSNKIKNSENKGKASRVLANKLAIALRKDYFRSFPQPLS
jgi:nucleolar protein 56